MQFIVVPSKVPLPKTFPWVKLARTRDLDQGIQSTFRVTFVWSDDDVLDLGFVKIIKRGQTKGITRMKSSFNELSDEYCSLGQNFRYYEIVFRNLQEYRAEFLSCLRDVANNAQIWSSFKEEPAFEKSLVRQSSAVRALHDVKKLLKDYEPLAAANIATEIKFMTSVGGSKFTLPLKFDSGRDIPRRINVIIGPNGAGKTILLSNLAFVASSKRDDRSKLAKSYGTFQNGDHDFGAVVAISYSAFDRFDVPGKTIREQKLLTERGEIGGYVYCGLRRISNRVSKIQGLKSIEELESELRSNLKRAMARERTTLLNSVGKILAEDFSFDQVGVIDILSHSQASPDNIRALSSGHKLVINIVVQLVAHLQPHSLVLFDEPESHLHPPLLAKLLQCLQLILLEMDSICVIATHSPVVLQEIPSGQVTIIRRANNATRVNKPRTETFGEDVGTLTSEVFQLSSDVVPFVSVLEQLATRYSSQEIENLFEQKLGFQARSYLQTFTEGSH